MPSLNKEAIPANLEPAANVANRILQLVSSYWVLRSGNQMIDRSRETLDDLRTGRKKMATGDALATASRLVALYFAAGPAAHGFGQIAKGSSWLGSKVLTKLPKVSQNMATMGSNVAGRFKDLGSSLERSPLSGKVRPEWAGLGLAIGAPIGMDYVAGGIRNEPVPVMPGASGVFQEQVDKVLDRMKRIVKPDVTATDSSTLKEAMEKQAFLPLAAAGYGGWAVGRLLFTALIAAMSAKGVYDNGRGIVQAYKERNWRKGLGNAGMMGLNLAWGIPAGAMAAKSGALMPALWKGMKLENAMAASPAAVKAMAEAKAAGTFVKTPYMSARQSMALNPAMAKSEFMTPELQKATDAFRNKLGPLRATEKGTAWAWKRTPSFIRTPTDAVSGWINKGPVRQIGLGVAAPMAAQSKFQNMAEGQLPEQSAVKPFAETLPTPSNEPLSTADRVKVATGRWTPADTVRLQNQMQSLNPGELRTADQWQTYANNLVNRKPGDPIKPFKLGQTLS